MVRISIPHYGTTEQVDVPRVSRKNSVSLPELIARFLSVGCFCTKTINAYINHCSHLPPTSCTTIHAMRALEHPLTRPLPPPLYRCCLSWQPSLSASPCPCSLPTSTSPTPAMPWSPTAPTRTTSSAFDCFALHRSLNAPVFNHSLCRSGTRPRPLKSLLANLLRTTIQPQLTSRTFSSKPFTMKRSRKPALLRSSTTAPTFLPSISPLTSRLSTTRKIRIREFHKRIL